MKIAVVYNREGKNVINLFGVPNREKYGKTAIKRIVDALKKGGHQVDTFEGDKQLITNLEKFMPRVVKGELPGMVFNISYGIQGEARYTHVPSILEMVGVPYVGSGPLAHSLALDKVVAKMIFRQNGLPTPDFVVLENSGFELPHLSFPMIVKPKNEAVSFGLKVVHDEKELRDGAQVIFDKYRQPVLAEQYVEGREINVGLLGNNPPETLPPVELIFGSDGPPVYTYEDKVHRSGRTIELGCPADISKELTEKAQDLARRAFAALGCYDCGRVDMRMDADGHFYILEMNSLASLGMGGSYVAAAKHIGLEYADLINRLVEVASARYFGTPNPPRLKTIRTKDKKEAAFYFLTERRDQIERRLREWCNISSRSTDPVGIRLAAQELSRTMGDIKMKPVEKFTDDRFLWMWNTDKGYEGGTLFIAHLDTPVSSEMPAQTFRRDPEYLFGEGIGSSRAPIVTLAFALRALRAQRSLHPMPMGVMVYADEGLDVQYCERFIRNAAKKAGRVIILRPGNPEDNIITQRRGLLKYRLVVEGTTTKLGQAGKTPQPLLWLATKLNEMAALSSRTKRLAVSASEFRADAFPMRLPHRATAIVVINYYDDKTLIDAKDSIRRILGKKTIGLKWEIEEVSNRPPMKERKINDDLIMKIKKVAEDWDIPFNTTSSLWPSIAGLVPDLTPVICGMGPIADQLYTPQESVLRISLIQRSLLLTQYLLSVEK
jgi:D-alanine-D-alanine ligase